MSVSDSDFRHEPEPWVSPSLQRLDIASTQMSVASKPYAQHEGSLVHTGPVVAGTVAGGPGTAGNHS